MVSWHSADAWLLPSERGDETWAFVRFFGGLAAPCFLLLTGVGAALSIPTGSDPRRRAGQLRQGLARGLQILLLGYVLRLQAWAIDAGALIQPWQYRALLPLAVGYGLAYWAAEAFAQRRPSARYVMASAILIGAGLIQVESVAPHRLSRLLQVDILNAIGASLCLLALGQHQLRLLESRWRCCLLALLVALLTQPVWDALPGSLPLGVAGYLGKYPPLPGHPPPAHFPLFPWLAYPLIGAALGVHLRRGERPSDRAIVLSLGGAALAVATSEAHPYVHTLIHEVPWLTQPLRVAFRVGIVSFLLLPGVLWTARRQRADSAPPLVLFGRTSLRIYWAHLLFAYGLLGLPLHQHASHATWLVWLALLLGLMWGLARVDLTGMGRSHSPAVRS